MTMATGCSRGIDRQCDVDALPAGTYYVKIDEYGNNDEIASYNLALTVVGACGDAYEQDDSWGQARWIGQGTPQAHSITPVGDADWVKLALITESGAAIETAGQAATR